MSTWHAQAACRPYIKTNGEGDYWHAPDVDGHEPRKDRDAREAKAKAVCATCPVQAECLADALARQERYGVWGGMTERERRAFVQEAVAA